jgi:3-isopropylmalate/(R)-2-methylmalate dehydratase small subunit
VYRESLIKNGMLPVVLAPADRPAFERQALAVDGQSPFEIDLTARTIACPDGSKITFEIDAGERKALLEGLDDVAMTLRHRLLIEAWESRVATQQPWLQQVTTSD